MTTLTDHDAFGHPAYESSLANAVNRASRERDACFSVYYDGEAIYVRDSKALAPPNSKLVCIAQSWDANTVQLRFNGAHSEWRYV